MFNTTVFENNDRDHSTWIKTLCEILYKSRSWHANQQDKHQLHPVVVKALAYDWPTDWKRVILEWPHVSTQDAKRLAYTRDERKGEADIQTVTSIGKYVKQHWPDMRDDLIQSLVYKFSAKGCEIRTTVDEILQAVQEGPTSCMQWDTSNLSIHPYRSYDPALGWAVAVRIGEDGTIDGRALVLETLVGTVNAVKCFVRTYKRNSDPGGYSYADSELEAWLEAQGYEHVSGWPVGTKLARVPSKRYSHGTMFPYLDGSSDKVSQYDEDTFVIRDNGAYCCEYTDGDANYENGDPCYDCESSTDDDEMNTAFHRGDEVRVCDVCLSRNYSRVYGTLSPYSESYYIRDSYVARVGGEDYDGNNLPEYIVDCDHGGYAHENDLVRCCVTDETYADHHCGDLVRLEDGRFCDERYAYCCEGDGEWYLESEHPPVTVGDNSYHPDNVPETEDEQESDADANPQELKLAA